MARPATAPAELPMMLATGSRIVIVVSSGPPATVPVSYVAAPDVVGKNQGDALSAMQDVGMPVQVFNDYSDSYKRGQVMGQLPAAGSSVPLGTEAVMLVSSGSAVSHTKSEPLPDVVGKSEADAVNAIQKLGFSPQVTREHSPSVPAGIVMAQLPNRASLMVTPPKQQNWWIWIITGLVLLGVGFAVFFFAGGGSKVTVPDVTNKTLAEAQVALEDAGLSAGSTETTQVSGVAEGTVVAQDPAAGTQAGKGSGVKLTVVSGKPLVAVPDVRNLTQAEALSQLEAAKLQASVTRSPSDTVDKGLVIEQTPAAGQQVPEGTTVGVVVSDGAAVENVDVPDVADMTQADAEKTLKDAGLKVQVAENPSADVAAGSVVTQVPAAGESVAPGTTVAIVISTGPPAAADEVSVPNVVGLTVAEAQQTLSDAGFEAQTVPAAAGSGKPANEVVAQTPAGDSTAQSGSTVVVFYSTGP